MLHLVCACALFVLLAVFSLFIFTLSGEGGVTPVGVVAFGVSWLVKGFAPALWADRQRNQGTAAGAPPRRISG